MPTEFHTRGNYAPVVDELDCGGLSVVGELPASLRGRYLRNGPNPFRGDARSWLSGEGMVHEVRIDEEGVRYRNRQVRTPWVDDPSLPKYRSDGVPDLTCSLANTHVIHFADRILALEENSFPYQLHDDLTTHGPWDFDGRLRTAMTAHPKECPQTGELHFFGYADEEPFLTYHVADCSGTLVHSTPISVPAPTMMHDVGLTERHVVFLDLPVVMQRRTRRQPSFAWDDTYQARIGVLPRHGSDSGITWFSVDPCYVFHVANCFERSGPFGDELVIDAPRYPELWRAGSEVFAPPSVMWRYVLELDTGRVREHQVDDCNVEFPRIDDRLAGFPARWCYVAGTRRKTPQLLVRYDLLGRTPPVEYDFGAARVPGEPVFVPNPASRSEDDGWLLCFVYDATRDTSDLVVIAADDVTAGPIATVPLPQRVPYGFHGTWIARSPDTPA